MGDREEEEEEGPGRESLLWIALSHCELKENSCCSSGHCNGGHQYGVSTGLPTWRAL